MFNAIHRIFFSEIYKHLEAGLKTFCEEKNISVKSQMQNSSIQTLSEIEEKTHHDRDVTKLLKKLRRKIVHVYPISVKDFLENLLERSHIPKRRKKEWSCFFDVLSIVRNKCSHLDITVTKNEELKLRKAGWGIFVSPKGEIQVGVDMYAQIARNILVFFNELNAPEPHV